MHAFQLPLRQEVQSASSRAEWEAKLSLREQARSKGSVSKC